MACIYPNVKMWQQLPLSTFVLPYFGAYPPPKLTTTVNGDNVEIDLSTLLIQVSA